MEQPPDSFTAIPGLTFRALRDAEDAARIVAVGTLSADLDQVEPLSTLEETPVLDPLLQTVVQTLERGNQENWLLVEVEGEPVAYGQVRWWIERDGTHPFLHLGKVAPDWRARGIGIAVLGWAEQRARQLAMALPATVRAELGANASEHEVEATALLIDAEDWVAFAMLEMELRPIGRLGATPLPREVEIRPALPEHCHAIGASVEEAYRASCGNGRFSTVDDPEGYATFLAGPGQDPTLWHVAWAGQDLVGPVLCRVERDRAEVFEVSVRPPAGAAGDWRERSWCAP